MIYLGQLLYEENEDKTRKETGSSSYKYSLAQNGIAVSVNYPVLPGPNAYIITQFGP